MILDSCRFVLKSYKSLLLDLSSKELQTKKELCQLFFDLFFRVERKGMKEPYQSSSASGQVSTYILLFPKEIFLSSRLMESALLKIEKLLLKKPRHFDHMKIASVTFPFSREKDKNKEQKWSKSRTIYKLSLFVLSFLQSIRCELKIPLTRKY